MSAPTWFVTGAASGLGLALAEHVLASGDRVVLGARAEHGLGDVLARYPYTALPVVLDVTDPAQRQDAVARAIAWSGGIDVLVNNAGIDFLGAIEEQTEADARAQLEVNFFAPLELVRLVLPGMRARGSGTIVNVSSMDGIASLPGNALYSASKFALEGLTEALWQELVPTGVRAFVVQPGSFRTGIETRTRVSGERIEDYDATTGEFIRLVSGVGPEAFPGDPQRAAAAIAANARAEDPRHWLVLGSDALRRIGTKVDAYRAELDAQRESATATDFPDSGQAVL
ncbi:SDR family NAD(P)-dependent oxidoreductase [Isoptericola sp. NPDC060257]|uniref:SDR family NAD(P)-dependent oxidoreductase n=1 Tax=Isoptericola sp. NPDC060257 TaxID=3347087 RepID=UPI00365ED9F9